MKKIVTVFVMLSLAGLAEVWAQSTTGVPKGQRGASPYPARQSTNSQLEGKGVPYSKDREQQQSRSGAKAANRSGSSSAADQSAAGGRNMNRAGKTGSKAGAGNASSSGQNNQ